MNESKTPEPSQGRPIEDGGPAYPRTRSVIPKNIGAGEVLEKYQEGMSLRDAFAIAALQGLLGDHTIGGTYKTLAEEAYEYSDAMIAARKVAVP